MLSVCTNDIDKHWHAVNLSLYERVISVIYIILNFYENMVDDNEVRRKKSPAVWLLEMFIGIIVDPDPNGFFHQFNFSSAEIFQIQKLIFDVHIRKTSCNWNQESMAESFVHPVQWKELDSGECIFVETVSILNSNQGLLSI